MRGRLAKQRFVAGRLGFRHVSHVDDELISVSRIDGERQPDRCAGPVIRCPEYLEYSDPPVLGQVEEQCLGRVWRTHPDPVAVPDLLQAEGIGQVAYGTFLDVLGNLEPLGPLRGKYPG